MQLGRGTQRAERTLALRGHWRAAGLPELEPQWQASGPGPELRYRNRVRCQLQQGPDGGRVGFFNPHKAADCPVLEASVFEGIEQARQLVTRHRRAFASFTSLEVRARDALGFGALVFSGMQTGARELADWPEPPHGWHLGIRGEAYPACQRWQVTDSTHVDVPLDAFLQINSIVNRALVEHVVDGLVRRKTRSFIDLYMGAGNFALPLLAAGLSGRGVESHLAAVRAAERSARAQGFPFEEACAGDTGEHSATWLAEGRVADAVVCDPPRAGMRQAVQLAAALARRTLVMCSCNPASLCRDLAQLVRLGFKPQQVALFDMFPHTSHVETVVWLERG